MPTKNERTEKQSAITLNPPVHHMESNEKLSASVVSLLGSLSTDRLIQTLERGIEMERLELEINPADSLEIHERMADASILLTCLCVHRYIHRRMDTNT